MAGRIKHPKEIQQLSLSPDMRAELRQQATDAGLSISAYIERIIFERSILRKNTGGGGT